MRNNCCLETKNISPKILEHNQSTNIIPYYFMVILYAT